MAPGLNGGGRSTGTVPKTKAHNESTREQGTQPHRRDFSFNHMNNNLAPADWQSLVDFIPVARSRKESNNSSSRYPEPNDIQDEAAVCPDNQWFPQALQPQVNYCSEDEQARWEEKRRKSNNILNPADQTQMNRRFVQICDYINQTSSLMDTLQPSGNSVADNGLCESNFAHGSASASSPDAMHQRNFPSQPTGSVPKSSDSTLRRNELKMKMEESQRKVLELREQSAIMALKHKAQEQLKEAQTAQRAWLAAATSTHSQPQSAPALSDANIQDSLNNLQRFYDGRNEIGEMLGCNSDCTPEVVQLQNKLKELQLKKSQMDQKILQYASFNTNLEAGDLGNMANGPAIHVAEQNVEDKIAELAVLREQLNRMQGVIAAIPALNTSQESETDDTVNLRSQQGKQDNRTQAVSHGSPGPSMAMASANIQAKSLRLREARSRLHHLQELLNFVEKLRDSGKPVPERILALLNNVSGFSDEDCGPLMDMSENSFQDLYQEVAAAVVSDKQRQPVKPNNTTAKLRARTQQLEEWMKKDDLMSSINTDINSQAGFSYQETPNTATWGGSTHGTMEDHNIRSPDFSSDGETENGATFMPVMNKASSAPTSHKESTSCTNIARDVGIDSASISGVNGPTSAPPPQNAWGKQSSGSGVSLPHGIWTPSSSFITQQPNRQENANSSEENGPNPDNRWIAQHILQMQAQLQQVCQNVTDKHHNIPPMSSPGNMWLPPFYPQNGPGFAGFNQFVASQQHQQLPINQLLVNSLNQCCQMIWHQQCELMAVKEAIQLIQQQQHHQHGMIDADLPAATIDNNPDTRSNLERATVVNRSPQNTSSPVLSVPHPHYFYPPYGNNLNFESFQHHSSPVGTFLPSPAGALNNQVPPGNRANNYWDNFRSYSRQNLLSVRSKTNDGLLTGERERTQEPNTGNPTQPHHHHHHYPIHAHPPVDMMTFNLSQNHKEKLNTHQSLVCEQASQAMASGEQPVRCSSNKPSQTSFHQNNCSDIADLAPQPETISKGACRKVRAEKTKEQSAAQGEAAIRSWNSLDESATTTRSKRHLRNTVSTDDLPRNSNFKRKADCKINPIRTDNNNEQMDSLEEAFYSEVAALISVNERQINYLLQLFRDLKHLNSDSDRQAALITIHNLATRACSAAAAAPHQPACCVKEAQQIETIGQEEMQEATAYQESQPRNLANYKETQPSHNQSNSCSKLDWEIRSVSVAMMPLLKAHFSFICGPSLLEEIRNFVLHLIPPQFRQDQLITSLDGALLKFQGCRLRDVYEELLGVVADVLINDVTFHRFVASMNNNNNNTNINNNNEASGDILVEEGAEGDGGEGIEEEEEEGAVGGVVEEEVAKPDDNSPILMAAACLPPACPQMVRCNKSDAVAEADLAEADQSRLPSGSGGRSCPVRLNGNSESEATTPIQDRRDAFLMDGIDHHLSLAHQRAEIERGLDQVPVQLNGAQSVGLDGHDAAIEHSLSFCSNSNSDVNQM